MPRTGKNKKESRHGKHADNMFRVSLYLSAEEKAMAILAAELDCKTLTDVLKSGLSHEATRLGILVNGRVADSFIPRVNAYRQILEAERLTDKER